MESTLWLAKYEGLTLTDYAINIASVPDPLSVEEAFLSVSTIVWIVDAATLKKYKN